MFRNRNLFLESLRRFDHRSVETLISGVLCHIVRTSSKPALFCTTNVQPCRLSWEASSQVILKKKLETALNDQRVDDAWYVFKDFKRLYGLPENAIMNRLVTVLSYSSNSEWLCKASDLTRLTLKQNPGMISGDVLTKLSLSLARAQMAEPTCSILRTMLERSYVPTSDVLRLIVMHIVRTEVGTCLASNYLVQVCDHFLGSNVSRRNSPGSVMKPDTVLFNLVLSSCVRFGFSLKGQELIELMAKVDVIADAYSIVIMSFIYEMNGMRDELRKLRKRIIGHVTPQLIFHYRHLFDNSLSLEFKFDDIGSAIEICKDKDLLSVQDLEFDSERTLVLPLGCEYFRSGLKIQISPNLLQRDSSLEVHTQASFVNYADNKLGITNKTLAKLVYGYKKPDDDYEQEHGYRRHDDDSPELTKLLFSLGRTRLCDTVIDACVAIGWLEAAHDILDDMYSAGRTMELATYRKLLSRYCKSDLGQAVVLLRYMEKAGLITDPSDEIRISRGTEEKEDESREFRDLLIQEINEGEQMKVPSMLYELNSSLYYFCKAQKMQEDALITYRKFQKMKIAPTRQSFWILIDMYSSLGMYREITVVWGDIKWNIESENLEVTQDLLEKIVVNFLRGGYFERVLEVINYMKENGMYNDLIMYKNEYLKHHKNLYRSLRASDAVTETQGKRVEHVKAFRKLVGLV